MVHVATAVYVKSIVYYIYHILVLYNKYRYGGVCPRGWDFAV